MKALLDELLKRVLPEGVDALVVPHEGKSDLERSIPKKLRGWIYHEDRFLVVRDNDGAPDCRALKRRLVKICADAGRPDALVRIVCQHLECWYLGDLKAVETAFSKSNLAQRQQQAKYRNPDARTNGSDLLRELVGPYGKVRRRAPSGRMCRSKATYPRAFMHSSRESSV